MSKILSFIEGVFGAVQGFAKTSPALAAGAVSVGVTLLAKFGLHVTPTALVSIVVTLNAILAGLVHVSTKPAQSGEHEKP
jgi:hypothetical protein